VKAMTETLHVICLAAYVLGAAVWLKIAEAAEDLRQRKLWREGRES